MDDFNNRCLTTEHDKTMFLYPESMGLMGVSAGTPLQIVMDDNEGITIQSHKKLSIYAVGGIQVKAPKVYMSAPGGLTTTQAVVSVSGDRIVANPKATIDLSGETDLEGETTKYAGWDFQPFEPFDDDAPKEGKFDGWGLFGKILVGIAVAVVVGVVVAAMVLAALVAIAAIAGTAVTASSITAAAVIGGASALAALGATAYTAYNDYQDGNVSDLDTYVNRAWNWGMTTGSILQMVYGIWNLATFIRNIPSMINNLGAALRFDFCNPFSGGAGALVLDGGPSSAAALERLLQWD